MLATLIFLPLIGCDRVSKDLAVAYLKGQESSSFVYGIFSLTYHENTGAMLSFGANFTDFLRFFVFTVLVGIALVCALVYIVYKPINKFLYIAYLLIITGGFGNLYDRAFNDGKVVDFMLIRLASIQTGVFNVADIAIMIGLFMFLFSNTKWGQGLVEKRGWN